MRIDRLNLRNIRCFVEAEFEFHPRFNLLVGENGSGKTSLLEGLAIAADPWVWSSGEGLSWGGGLGRKLRVTHQGRASLEDQFPRIVRARGEAVGDPVAWELDLQRSPATSPNPLHEIARHVVDEVRAGEPRTLPVLALFGTGRLGRGAFDPPAPDPFARPTPRPEIPSGKLSSRLGAYSGAFDARGDFPAALEWLRREKYIGLQEGAEGPFFGAVKHAILECVEGARTLDYDVREEGLVIGFGSGELPMLFQSEGRQRMIAMVAEIGYRASLLNPHLGEAVLEETPGIVLIDEIDLHLHPRWQRHVVADLKRIFPKVQFFATTHSPQVIGETPRDEILVLEGDRAAHPDFGLGADSNWILEHVMGGDERNAEAGARIDAIEDALDAGDWNAARAGLESLRALMGGEGDGEYHRLKSSLFGMEALAREAD